jgi:CRISPR-associated endonuclease/helicase Cas3
MVNFRKKQEQNNEKKKRTSKQRTQLADAPDAGGTKKALPGKHTRPGTRLHGVRGRTRKPQNAERVSEESEDYTSTTRFIESSLGIKSYAELAPYLAQGVERVMASLLGIAPVDLRITPDFVRKLHREAFEGLFPAWAGQYRDRDVTVGKHTPPPHYEVPVLMRQYCDDLDARLTALGPAPPLTDGLLETLAFAEGRFLFIHPFYDFNGRVARMLLFALLYRLELPPVKLVPEEAGKAEYLAALSESDKGNLQPLMEIWRGRFKTA